NITAQPIASSRLSSNTVKYQVSWDAKDVDGIAAAEARLSINGGPFMPRSLASPTAHSFTFVATAGSKYQVSVQAKDGKGEWSNIAYGRIFTPTIVQQNASGVHYSSGWSAKSVASASGGSLEVTKVTNASVTFTTKATGVAFVATSAPNGGYARVYIDHN